MSATSPSKPTVDDDDDVPREESYGVLETYSSYNCDVSGSSEPFPKCQHPDSVLETASLGSVAGPRAKLKLRIPKHIFEEKRLSSLQAETISLVYERHETVLLDGSRAGFLIGDGPGVGKGRTIAGVICENFLAGRKKACWVSLNLELMAAAERDFKDLNIKDSLPIRSLKDIKYAVKIDSVFSSGAGCLFASYSSIIQHSIINGVKYNRLNQIFEWLTDDFDGVIVFDECHRTKNLLGQNGHSPSHAALAVQSIQQRLRNARIVYASATGACFPSEMGYMSRLGLWGPKSPFETFDTFLEAVNQCGVVGMEAVAMDMKLRGVYVARQLSFLGSTFNIEVCKLSKADLELYNNSVEAWALALHAITESLNLVNPDKKERAKYTMSFWSAHLRYFRVLCVSLKLPRVVEIARDAISKNQSVVLGLQTTGEANLNDYVANTKSEELSSGLSVCEGIFKSVLAKFPDAPENVKVQLKLAALKKNVVSAMNKIKFPENPLDALVYQLGGPNCVAEMTGRKSRVVYDPVKSIHRIESRSKHTRVDSVNLKERDAFMNGTKKIAIISDAASVGISLHSDRRVENKQRRIHITLELPWAADKAIQQFGRTLRSNQVNSPHYILCVSDVGGENRFGSAVAKRMECMGAITQGDRRSSEMHNFSSFNVDNEFGHKALKNFVDALKGNTNDTSVPPRNKDINFLTNARNNLALAGFCPGSKGTFSKKTVLRVPHFLNRLLGVKMPLQNEIFEFFCDNYDAVVSKAKKNGTFNEGIVELSNNEVEISKKDSFAIGKQGACQLYSVEAELGLPWEDALELVSTNSSSENGFYVHKRYTSEKAVPILVVCDMSPKKICSVWRPNTGLQTKRVSFSKVSKSYDRIDKEKAKQGWEERYRSSATECSHKWWTGTCKTEIFHKQCNEGLRHKVHYVLAGSFWLLMPALKSNVPSLFSNIQLCRFVITGGVRIAGILVPNGEQETVKNELFKMQEKWKIIDEKPDIRDSETYADKNLTDRLQELMDESDTCIEDSELMDESDTCIEDSELMDESDTCIEEEETCRMPD